MNKKYFFLLLVMMSSKSAFGMGSVCYFGSNAQQRVNNAVAASSANSAAIQEINKKLASLEPKDTEVNILKKDLDETKKLLQETQSQMQAQNSMLLQHKKEVITAITDFNQQAQSLMADAAKQSNMLAQLQETHKRIASSLALFETSKTTGWEAAFVQTLKKEFEL